jgi:hypothetical protein
MKDFTYKIYRILLNSFKEADFYFYTFEEFLTKKNLYKKCVILRHDVDKKPQNSLKTAVIENQLGIKASYYFRIKKCSYNGEVIEKIAKLGHEIGYHYENLATVNGDYKKAIMDFNVNLAKFCKYYPVKTICMHGSPLSKYDNKLLWSMYNYREFDIIGEPYFDIDFNEVFYLTDTGRMWDGNKASIRDKVNSSFTQKFKSTCEIINALQRNKLPDKIMITTHPQRWNDNLFPWLVEFLIQNLKNIIKIYYLLLYRRSKCS